MSNLKNMTLQKREWMLPLLSSIGFMVLCHGFMLMNPGYSHDGLNEVVRDMGEYQTDVKIHSPVPKGISALLAKRESILFAEHAVSAIKNVRISKKFFVRSWTEHHLFVMSANRSVPALSENNFIERRKPKKVINSSYLRLALDSTSLRRISGKGFLLFPRVT